MMMMMVMMMMMRMMMLIRPVSITLKTLPISTSGGPSLDREPEHGAGRQQEALPDERRDRPPLHLDEDDLRGALCVFCLLKSHQFNQLSKLPPPGRWCSSSRGATLASEAIQVSLRRCPTSTSPHQQQSHDVGWSTWRQPSWAGGLLCNPSWQVVLNINNNVSIIFLRSPARGVPTRPEDPPN